jgi:hypothetical protein
MRDFEHFCDATGDTLLVSDETAGILTFLIRKADAV